MVFFMHFPTLSGKKIFLSFSIDSASENLCLLYLKRTKLKRESLESMQKIQYNRRSSVYIEREKEIYLPWIL